MYSVLVVDDSSFMRKWLKRIIEQDGFRVTAEATNGFEAILQYRKTNPDIILLDIHMPKLAGVDVLKRIMSINPKANVIICSAMGSSFLIEECLKLGAKEFVKKPHFEGLIEKMNRVLEANEKTVDD